MAASHRTWIGTVAAAFVIVIAGARPAEATPIVSIEYVETSLGGGLFGYDYTLYNLGDPLLDQGFDVYDVALFFSPATSVVNWTVPTGWDAIPGVDFFATFSLQPGASPLGADVGPGQSLGGFNVVFGSRVGSLPFQVFFSNPLDPANPLPYQGVTTAAVTPVPEPGVLLLLGVGTTVLALRRPRRNRA